MSGGGGGRRGGGEIWKHGGESRKASLRKWGLS